ncbi:MAG: 7-carboxy-7-deazaguanine synthase [Bacteroidota bacterium]
MEYPVMESFYTLQGEGKYSGNAAYFIRLGGCDVGCVWCDVKESWPVDTHPIKTSEEIVEKALEHQGRIAVITGGEPIMHNLDPITIKLKLAGFRTHIETSGVGSWSGTWDWVCLSPKKFKNPNPEVFKHANELKIIVYNKSDFKWAEAFVEKMSEDCLLYLQPEWSKKEEMTDLIIDYIKENPHWKLSLQTHKYIDIP